MALLLPAGIIFSWLVIPNPVPVKLISSANAELLPVIQAKKDTLPYCINIRSDAEKTNWQLEWRNKLPLTVPSAVIYKVPLVPGPARNDVADRGTLTFKPEGAELIGRIEATGDYVFPLKHDDNDEKFRLVVYDFIHDTVIDFVTLNIPF